MYLLDKVSYRRIILLAGISIMSGGCVITNYGCSRNYTAHKQLTTSAQCKVATQIVADLTHTDLNITGDESEQCIVAADITVHAETQEIADEVCELIRVQVLDGDPCMTVSIVRPDIYKGKYSVSAKMNITAPRDKQLDFSTTHGDCRISNFQNAVSIRSTHGDIHMDQITGDVKTISTHGNIAVNNTMSEAVDAGTSHGQISLNTVTARTVSLHTTHAPVKLQQVSAASMNLGTTHDPIHLSECRVANIEMKTSHAQISGDLHETNLLVANTTHGSINLTCINAANPQIKAELGTTHADITFTPPVDFAGTISLSTTHGNIKTDRPVVVQGMVGNNQMNGSIGQGQGTIRMKSTHGNLMLK